MPFRHDTIAPIMEEFNSCIAFFNPSADAFAGRGGNILTAKRVQRKRKGRMKMEQRHLEDLIYRSREGDSTAQAELVEAAQNRVYYHCKKCSSRMRTPRMRPRMC